MSEITFEVCEDEADGATAAPLGDGIDTPKAALEESRATVKDAVDCYLDETMEAPR
jgi:hypothetical protein